MSRGRRNDLENRIQELGDRLSSLGTEDKRIKKRILQQLGKLKKELASVGENTGTEEVEGAEEKPEGSQAWTKKQCKLKLKIANSDLAELAQKKQLKAAQKKFQWCVKKGLKPGDDRSPLIESSSSFLTCCLVLCQMSTHTRIF
jgi:hypothetical protein